jgi:hypothetical protein
VTDETLDRLIANWTAAGVAAGLPTDVASGMVWKAIVEQIVPRGLDQARIGRWFGSGSSLPPALTSEIRRTPLPVDGLGAAFERTAHLRLTGTTKRDAGMYFTRADLADFAVERIVASLRSSGMRPDEWRILDPAAGAGAFAHALITRLANELPAEYLLTQVIRLIDVDPLAVAVSRGLLLAQFGTASTDLDAIETHIARGDSVIGGPYTGPSVTGIDWEARFPDVMATGGFSAIIGNPPWGAIKPAIREYAASVAPELLKLDTTAMRAALGTHEAPEVSDGAHERRAYATALRASGYVLQGKGDLEFYKLFVELAQSLIRPGGVIGLLVPSALQRAAGAADLRKRLLGDGSFELWLDFINTRAFFKIHKMFRFSLIVWRQGAIGGIARIAFGLTSVDDARSALDSGPVHLSPDYLASVSPLRRTIPEVRTRGEADLYSRLHGLFPALERPGAPGEWNVRFRREVDMTNDARLFVPRQSAIKEGAVRRTDGAWIHPRRGVLLPVYEGRMVHQFDAAAKAHIDGHGRSAKWRVLSQDEKTIQPRYLIPEEDAAARGVPRRTRAAFCDITGHANERTVLAALVPSIAVCGNKVPTCEFDSEDPDVALVWLALANSLVIDWIARRRVSTTLNFFHWNELPIPRVNPASEVGKILVDAGRKLNAPPGRLPQITAAERSLLRSRIDVAVAQLYELDLPEMTLVLQDFPLLDRRMALHHRTVTRDLVLAGLAAARGESDVTLSDLNLDDAGPGPRNIVERAEWHATAGAVGYVPGEQGSLATLSA